jgi:aspartate kinase
MSAAEMQNGHAVASREKQCVLKRNNSSGPWIVQKFGGTSVGKFAVNIAEDIVG